MKSALKKLAPNKTARDTELSSVYTFTASNAGDVKFSDIVQCKDLSTQMESSSSSSSCSSYSASGSSQSMSAGGSELSSFAASGFIPKTANVLQNRVKRADSPRVGARAAIDASSSSGGNCRSSSDSSSDSASFSVPESETHWLQLPALKPLINPSRLQALRLYTRDRRVPDAGAAPVVPTATTSSSRVQFAKTLNRDDNSNQSQKTLTGSYIENSDDPHHCHQNYASPGKNANSRQFDEASSAWSESGSSCGGRSELRMAESTNCSRRAIYQFSFRVAETKANMRAFTDPSDRRVEAIARACDSEILLDPEPIRASSSMKLRRVTIRAPDPHCLEKCCRMFDDKFPHFYVSGGLGPGCRCISKVYDDGEEKYISMSNDERS